MARLISAGEPGALDEIVAVLEQGGTVVLPTDTVYGLAALPGHPAAIEQVFELKARPAGMHLAVLVADATQVALVSDDDRPGIRAIGDRFWPGALTMVLGRARRLVSGLGAMDGTIGVRCPDHELVRGVAARVGPIAATSANLHGRPTPETAVEIAAELPDVDLVVDAGPCPGGLASTVVRFDDAGPVVLREGPIPVAALAETWVV